MNLFLIALWAFCKAHPNASFNEFQRAADQSPNAGFPHSYRLPPIRSKSSGGLQTQLGVCHDRRFSFFIARCAVSGGDPSVSQRGRAA